MTVTTNHHRRLVHSFIDLQREMSSDEIAKFRMDFSYISFEQAGDWTDEAAEYRFVKAYGRWFDVQDTQRIESSQNPSGMRHPFSFVVGPGHPLHPWAAIDTQTFGSGFVFKFVQESEFIPDDIQCVVGYWQE